MNNGKKLNLVKNKKIDLAIVSISGLVVLIMISLFLLPAYKTLSVATAKSEERFEMVEALTSNNGEDAKYIQKLEQSNAALYNSIKNRGKGNKDDLDLIKEDIKLIKNNANYSSMGDELSLNAKKVEMNLENVIAIKSQRVFFNKILFLTILTLFIFIFFLIRMCTIIKGEFFHKLLTGVIINVIIKHIQRGGEEVFSMVS